MTFMDWVEMSTFIDMVLITFVIASVWKMRKLNKEIINVKNQLHLTIKNPQLAKRKLNSQQQ